MTELVNDWDLNILNGKKSTKNVTIIEEKEEISDNISKQNEITGSTSQIDEIISVNSFINEPALVNISIMQAETDEILVKNMQKSFDPTPELNDDKDATNSLSTYSKVKLSRNNSSTFSAKSHYSIRSGILVNNKSMNNESINDSMVNNQNLSIKRLNSLSNSDQRSQSNNLNNTRIDSINNPQGRILNTFDTVSATSTSNRSIYSFNRIANISNIDNNNLNTSESLTGGDLQDPIIEVKDPVIIRGAGNITIFGVSNKFNEAYPSQLYAKLAPEEFRDTLKQINTILSRELANSFRWLVFGSVFCCCTLGCSLFPVIFMNKKARLSINKFLSIENQRLYLKLGLKWKLAKIKCNSNSLMEYVFLIEFLPTVLLYQPD